MSDLKKPFNDKMGREISESEPITRYVFSNSQFKKKKLLWKSFDKSDGIISVMRTEGLKKDQILELGIEHVGALSDRKLIGYFCFEAKAILECGLKIKEDTKSHNRHANIYFGAEKESRIKNTQNFARHLKLNDLYESVPAPT